MALSLQTIKKRSTFIHVRDKGSFIKSKSFNVQLLQDTNLNQMIVVGYIATKKMGSAINRNRAKRIMRELAKKVLIKYGKKNTYYVLIAKNSLFSTPFVLLEMELRKLIS